MTKSLMLSIRPEHLVNILKGKKTLELRKTVPKNFKGWVYIYITKSKPYIRELGKGYYTECSNVDVYKLNGKVVARFWFDETYYITQSKNVYGDKLNQISIYDNKNFGWKAPKEQQETLKQLCLTEQQVLDYGKGKDLYAWHIKDLEIFKDPMELSEFYRIKNDYKQEITPVSKTNFIRNNENYKMMLDTFKVKRPPQSWQYVYVEGEEG